MKSGIRGGNLPKITLLHNMVKKMESRLLISLQQPSAIYVKITMPNGSWAIDIGKALTLEGNMSV